MELNSSKIDVGQLTDVTKHFLHEKNTGPGFMGLFLQFSSIRTTPIIWFGNYLPTPQKISLLTKADGPTALHPAEHPIWDPSPPISNSESVSSVQ